MSVDEPQLIIENEVLPEIEIRELLSIEEMLEENPTFVTYSDEEILELIHDFVQSYKKAGGFLDILKGILRDKKSDLQNVVPILWAEKQDFSNVEEWNQRVEEISQAPGYPLRQSLFQKLQYPLQHVAPDREEMGFLPPRRMEVGFNGSLDTRTVVFPTDEVPQSVKSVVYQPPSVSQYTYLIDRIYAKKAEALAEVEVSAQAMGTLINQLEAVKPDWEAFLASLKVFPDQNELKHQLEVMGMSWDDLTEEQWISLQEKLVELPMPEEEKVTGSKTAPKYISVHEVSFVDALMKVMQTPFDKMKYGALYQAYAASIPPQNATVEVPLTAFEIAEGLRGTQNGKLDIADVATFLRYVRNRYVMDMAGKAVDAFQAMEPEMAQAKLAAFTEQWKRVQENYRDRTALSFLEMYKDIAEWKRGMDTDAYEGNMNRPVLLFEEMQYDYVIPEEEDEDLPVQEDTYAVSDDVLRGLSMGLKELLRPVLYKMRKLADISGLPLSLTDLIAYLSSRMERMSFEEILQQNAPELSATLIHDIAYATYSRAMSLVGQGPARTIVEKMHQQFLQDKARTFLDACAWWAMVVQEDSIYRRLAFDPVKGLASCMHVWTPVGAPIRKDKNEGPLMYIACVAHDTGVLKEFHWDTEHFKQQMLTWIAAHMEEKVATLKQAYADWKKEVDEMAAKTDVLSLLEQSVKAREASTALSNFIASLLSMPSLLSGQKRANASGCCMQQLNPAFTADTDWAGQSKFQLLRKIKDTYGRQRMTKMARPELASIPPMVEEAVLAEKRTVFIAPEVSVESMSPTYLRDWILRFHDSHSMLLPQDIVAKIANDIPHCKTLATQTMKLVLGTIGKKKSTMLASLEAASLSELIKCFDRIHKVLAGAMGSGQEELTYIETAISALSEFKKEFRKLQGVSKEQNIIPLKNLAILCVVRAVCLPAVPEDAQGTILTVAKTVSNNFIKGIVQSTVRTLEQMFDTSTMPTMEEVQHFITNMREQQKQKAIDEFETLSIADQEILREAKKLGLVKKDAVVAEEAAAEDEGEDADYTTTGGDTDLPMDDL